MRVDVRVQRQVLYLHFHDPAMSARAIGAQCHLSHNTVKKLKAAAQTCGMSWDELDGLDDEQWVSVLGTGLLPQLQPKARPDWAYIHQEMARADATLEVLWREFREGEANGVGYTLFAEGYREWVGKQRISMRRVYIPGERLCADFAGRKIPITNPQTGEIREANVFVSVMPASGLTFIEAVWSQQVQDWVQCMVDSMAFFGGAPKWVVSDNLKSAITSRTRDLITVNHTYTECLRHYGCAALPARPRKPKDDGKAKVENAVGLIQRWVLFSLRDRVFFSLEELNTELRLMLTSVNDRPMTGGLPSRRERFISIDQPALAPLPSKPYEYAEWRINVRVGADYLVEHEKSFYSVPHTLCHEQVDLRYTQSLMEIYRKRVRITSHEMAVVPGTVRMRDEHRPQSHRRVLDGEPRALMLWSEAAGKATHQMIKYHLMDRADLTNGLRAARRMRDFARAFGEPRFEAVCAYALPLNMTALRRIESILKSKADLNPSNQAESQNSADSVIDHENLRGAEYFGAQ